jgi:hypothetical protein
MTDWGAESGEESDAGVAATTPDTAVQSVPIEYLQADSGLIGDIIELTEPTRDNTLDL